MLPNLPCCRDPLGLVPVVDPALASRPAQQLGALRGLESGPGAAASFRLIDSRGCTRFTAPERPDF